MPVKLTDFYQARVREQAFTDDPHQQAGIAALQYLLDALIQSPRRPEETKNFISLCLRAFVTHKREPLRGIYLHGPVGRGKSMLMDMFFNAIPDAIPKRRVHFHAFMIEVHDFLHRSRQKQKDPQAGPDMALIRFAEKLAQEVRVLCFDEFHVVDVADAMILSRLFTALLDQGLAVVMTSNWPPERLYENGLQRDRFLPFIALIRSRMEVVALEGPVDYRLRKLEDSGVYFWPLGQPAQEWASAMFTELSGGAPAEGMTLAVRGHQLDVPQAARGVVRFTFAQLCENPVGAEDYLTIAREFHTVLLEGVPKLRYDRRNEAKRLMTLVDTLYDTGTRLVVTADAPPEKLYFGSDHGFEFTRTVSRLLEMQSRDWLEKTEQRQAV